MSGEGYANMLPVPSFLAQQGLSLTHPPTSQHNYTIMGETMQVSSCLVYPQ